MGAFRLIVYCLFLLCLTTEMAWCGGNSQNDSGSCSPVGSSANSGGTSGSGSSGGTEVGSSGAGDAGSPSLSSPVVYVLGTSQSFSPERVQFAGFIDARVLDVSSGALTPIPGSPFSINYSTAEDMVLAPNGRFAYVLVGGLPGGPAFDFPSFVLVYTLDPKSGSPTLKQTLAIDAVNLPGPISIHPSGQFVYLSNYYQPNDSNNNKIAIFSVQSDGTLVFNGFTGPIQHQASDTVIHPSGRFLYTVSGGPSVGNLGNQSCGLFSTKVWAFRIDFATGAVLTPVAGSPFTIQRQLCKAGVGPKPLRPLIDRCGQRLFMIDSGNRTITVLGIDSSNGTLTLLPGSTVDTDNSGPIFYAAAVDPKGRFVYVGGPSSSFTGFSFTSNSETGILPVLPGMPVHVTSSQMGTTGSNLMAIDSSGTFLFGNENGFTSAFSCCFPDLLVEFRIDPNTGALTEVPSATIMLAGSASKMVVAPPR
jgi:6-phosphogluconolactonase (cycloisomerase 2 family)